MDGGNKRNKRQNDNWEDRAGRNAGPRPQHQKPMHGCLDPQSIGDGGADFHRGIMSKFKGHAGQKMGEVPNHRSPRTSHPIGAGKVPHDAFFKSYYNASVSEGCRPAGKVAPGGAVGGRTSLCPASDIASARPGRVRGQGDGGSPAGAPSNIGSCNSQKGLGTPTPKPDVLHPTPGPRPAGAATMSSPLLTGGAPASSAACSLAQVLGPPRAAAAKAGAAAAQTQPPTQRSPAAQSVVSGTSFTTNGGRSLPGPGAKPAEAGEKHSARAFGKAASQATTSVAASEAATSTRRGCGSSRCSPAGFQPPARGSGRRSRATPSASGAGDGTSMAGTSLA